MSQTAGIAHEHKTRGETESRMDKAVAYVPAGGSTKTLWVFGELVAQKGPSHQTGGAYALFEAATGPGAGPPPHVHHREDEAFYVLDGEYEFLVEGHTLRTGAGSLIYVPKGTLHAHRNVGKVVSRMLMSQTPGGLYELFFEKAGRTADGGDGGRSSAVEDRPDVKSIAKIAAEYGIEIPPPITQ
jgi:mannose-6-phosphate isomerase-like protein (cupin superfamily)